MDLHNPTVIGTLTLEGGAVIASNEIAQADSSVVVTDSGANGTITFTADGASVAVFTDSVFDIRVGGNTWLSNRDDYLYFGVDWANDNSMQWLIDGSGDEGNFDIYSHSYPILNTGLVSGTLRTTLAAEGTESIILNSDANTITIKASAETQAVFNGNAAVELYYDNVKVAETTANGITGAVWG